MNPIDIPVAPAGVILLINFFAPYGVSLIIGPKWSNAAKKWVGIAVAAALAGLVLAIYYLISGVGIPSWPALVLLGVVVTQTSYATVLKDSANGVTNSSGTGSSAPLDLGGNTVTTLPPTVSASTGTLPNGALQITLNIGSQTASPADAPTTSPTP